MNFPSYRLKQLHIAPALVLSPMSGVTCSAFRRLIRELNPGSLGLVMTEFISVEALTRRVPRSLQMMRFREQERPVGVQIFGYDIERMSEAARMAVDAGADVVDINCGCPAPKVVRKGGGCELMRQPDQLKKIIVSVRKAIEVPLTIKIRSGWDEQSLNALDIAVMAEGEGVDGLAIHGRTRSQLYRGAANWEIVNQVAAKVKIPVFGSGDICSAADAYARLGIDNGGASISAHSRSNPVAGLFIGRGAISNPLIFREIMAGSDNKAALEECLVLRVLERYAQLLEEDLPPKACIGRMKQLAAQFCRGLSFSISAHRKALLRAMTWPEQVQVIKQWRECEFAPNSLERQAHPICCV